MSPMGGSTLANYTYDVVGNRLTSLGGAQLQLVERHIIFEPGSIEPASDVDEKGFRK